MKNYTIGRRAAHTAGLCALWTIVVFSVESSTVQAATCTSNGTGGGAWSTSGAWQSGCTGANGVPGSGDDVVILAGDIVTVDSAGVTVHSLNVSGTLNAGSQSTFTVASDVTIGSTGLLQAPSNRLYVGGNWGGTGLFTHNGGTVEFNGSAQQQITTARTGSTKRFNHASVSGAGGLIAKFSLDATGNLAVTSVSGGLSAQGKWTFALTTSKVMDCDGSCSFADLEVRTVDASGSTSPVVVGGALVIVGSGSVFTAPPDLRVGGNWSNSGTFAANGGTVWMNGTSNQTVTGATVFSGLTVDNPAGVSLASSTTVNGTLLLTTGRVQVGANTLTLGPSASVSGGSTSAMVVTDVDGSSAGDGYLCKKFQASVFNPPAFTFPVGDAYNTAGYSPATLDFSSGAFSSDATLCVRVTDAVHPDNNGTDKLGRYWSATASNITAYSADVTFQYVDADVTETGASEGNLYGVQRTGSFWKILNAVNGGANTFAGTVDTLGDFTAGNSSLPATLSFFQPMPDDKGGVRFAWQTTGELGNVGFNLYVDAASGRRRLNDPLIASAALDSFAPQDYSLEVRNVAGDVFYLEEVDVLGRTRLHGPFVRGQAYGKPASLDRVDWDGIQAEFVALQSQREAGWREQAQARVEAARQAASATTLKASLSTPYRTFLPMIAGTQTGGPLHAPWLELRVRQDGLYRVTYEHLAAAGVDLAGVPAAQLALLNQGLPVLRRMVSGDLFGPGAYFEFYGQAVDTLYTDTAVYRLLLDAALAQPMAVDDTPAPGGPSAAFYVQTDTWETERAYGFSSPNGDPWYDTRLLAYTSPITKAFEFVAEDLLPGAAPTVLAVTLWGGTEWLEASPDHHVVVKVNGQSVAGVQFNGIAAQSIEVTLPEGLVQPGANVLALVLPGDTGVAWDVVMLDSYSLTYPRRVQARNNTLRFRAAAGRFTVTGLSSSDVSVYRLDGDGPVHLAQAQVSGSAGEYQATFAGTGEEATYLVAAGGGILAPGLTPARPAADITSGTVEYLMIAHPNFIAGIQPLAQFHRARGLDVRVVDVEDVYDRFSHGVFGPEAIRDYVRYAVQHMGTQMVLLVGGDTYNYRHYLGQGSISFIPSPYAATDPVLVRFAPVDPLYADLNDDLVPDLPIGRLPVRTVQELSTVVAKTLAYASKDYEQTGVFAADAPDGTLSFETDSDALLDELPVGWSAERAYLGSLGLAAARDLLLSQMNAGVALTAFFGHSGMTHWSFDNLFTTADAQSLTNAGRPTVVTQWGCWNTYHVMPDYNTLGHKLLLSGDRGAAAVLGASTLTLASSDRALGLLMTPRLAQPGVSLGLAIQEAKETLAASHPDMTDVLLGWTLLGDPALIVTQ